MVWFLLILWTCGAFTVGFFACALLAAYELERRSQSSGER